MVHVIDALLALIPGGGLTAIIALIATALGALGWGAAKVKKAGVDEQKAKEAEARAKNLDRIKRARRARPRGGVHDDPDNRDNDR
jgi:hypothetical protein